MTKLRGEHDLVAAAGEQFAEDRLAAAAVAVDVSGVEQRHAGVDRRIDDGPGRLGVDS